MVCVFFGHRDCTADVCGELERILRMLITEQGVTDFYIGNQGDFDYFARKTLLELKKEFPYIRPMLAHAYIDEELPDGIEPIFLEGLECVPRRFAIDRRNRMLVERADFVVSHIRWSWGGAAKFISLAQKAGKKGL